MDYTCDYAENIVALERYSTAKARLADLQALRNVIANGVKKHEEYVDQLNEAKGKDIFESAKQGGDIAGEVMSKLRKAQDKLSGMKETLLAADEELKIAQKNVVEARCAGLRALAHDLVRQAEKRQAKTDQLLAGIEEWEGCKYAPDNNQFYKELGQANSGVVGYGYIVRSKFISSITQNIVRRAAGLELDANALEAGSPLPTDPQTGQLLCPLPEEYKD